MFYEEYGKQILTKKGCRSIVRNGGGMMKGLLDDEEVRSKEERQTLVKKLGCERV